MLCNTERINRRKDGKLDNIRAKISDFALYFSYTFGAFLLLKRLDAHFMLA